MDTRERAEVVADPYLPERERRWQRVREFVRSKGLDALVVAGLRGGEPFDLYLSNGLPGGVVVFPREGDPVLLARGLGDVLHFHEAERTGQAPWIRDIRPGARGTPLAGVLKEFGCARGRVGVVGLSEMRTDWEGWIPFRTWERVREALPECTFEDVASGFAELLMVKSEAELARVREAAQVLETASEAMLDAARPGASERDVYAAIRRVLNRAGVFAPMLILRSGPANPSWGQPDWLFCPRPPRALERGDVVQAEIFANRGGLETQVQMSVALPPVSRENAECAELARASYVEGLRALRPGRTFGEVVDAMEAPLARPGVWHVTPLIHSMNPMLCICKTGVGIENMPGAERFKGLAPGRTRGAEVVLKPGMVFELEPNACLGRHRVNIGGTVIVTEDSAQELNRVPSEMRLGR